jgi:hypothetical protein
MWHLIMAGAAGGMKDVPATILEHPLVFATLTAPTFGIVHASKKLGRSGSRRCHPRSGSGRRVCAHGRPLWCMSVHDHADFVVGQPLCPDCYDSASQLVWQWWAPELWRRFTIALRRRLASHLGLSESACKQLVRVQFAKVAEFQRRGVIHFHALIRLDGHPTPEQPFPPPALEVPAVVLAELVQAAARAVWFDAPAVDELDGERRLRFGRQIDAQAVRDTADRDDVLGGELHPETVGAYIAKYATKAAADLGASDQSGNPHLRRLKTTHEQLAVRAEIAGLTRTNGPYKGWGRWVDMLGFRGHFASKSRRYSTTLGRLRQARRDHTRRRLCRERTRQEWADRDDQADELEDTTLVIGSWRYAGMGWLTAGDAALAAASAARARDHEQTGSRIDGPS